MNEWHIWSHVKKPIHVFYYHYDMGFHRKGILEGKGDIIDSQLIIWLCELFLTLVVSFCMRKVPRIRSVIRDLCFLICTCSAYIRSLGEVVKRKRLCQGRVRSPKNLTMALEEKKPMARSIKGHNTLLLLPCKQKNVHTFLRRIQNLRGQTDGHERDWNLNPLYYTLAYAKWTETIILFEKFGPCPTIHQ